MVFSTQEFFLFTQELINFTQEILPLSPKKLRTPYSRNLRVPTYDGHMITGEEYGLNFLTYLRVEVQPLRNLKQEADPTGDRTRARCVRSNDFTPRPQRW